MRRTAAVMLLALLGLTGCTARPSVAPDVMTATSSPVAAPTAAAPSAAARPGRTPPSVASAAPPPSSGQEPPPPAETSTDADTDPGSLPELEPTPSADESATTAGPVAGGFSAGVDSIDADLAARMASSWRAGCPVPLTDLRRLTLTYRGFDGADHQGELVVAATVADDVVAIFRQLYAIGYPISSMRLVDDFGGDDDESMAANNTSAFNCRSVTGGAGFSEHSYGIAVDVNPVQNPYISGSTVLPADGRGYVTRPNSPGVIHDGDEVVRVFAGHGFRWGGHWTGPVDYQHFSTSGR